MEKYIDKSALVAEINNRLEKLWDSLPNASDVVKDNYTKKEANVTGKYTALESFRDYINTLEVKEVDLEKEVFAYMNNEMKFLSDEVGYDTLLTIAKHFFELGMAVSNKAQKGEKV